MNSIVKAFGNFKDYYLNNATTTIDVIVIEQPNGEFLSSPLHVCINIMNFIKMEDYKFEMKINGKLVEIPLKYRDTGEACIIDEEVVSPKNSFSFMPEEDRESESFKEAETNESIENFEGCLFQSSENLSQNKDNLKKGNFSKSMPELNNCEKPLFKTASENFIYRNFPSEATNDILQEIRSLIESKSNTSNSEDNFSACGRNFYNDENSTSKAPNETPDCQQDVYKDEIQKLKSTEIHGSQGKKSTIGGLLKGLVDVIRLSSLSKDKMAKKKNIEEEDSVQEENLAVVTREDALDYKGSSQKQSEKAHEMMHELESSEEIAEVFQKADIQSDEIDNIGCSPDSLNVSKESSRNILQTVGPKIESTSASDSPNSKIENKSSDLSYQYDVFEPLACSEEKELVPDKKDETFKKLSEALGFTESCFNDTVNASILYANTERLCQSTQYLNQEFLPESLGSSAENMLFSSLRRSCSLATSCNSEIFSGSLQAESFDESKFLKGIVSSELDVPAQDQSSTSDKSQTLDLEKSSSSEGIKSNEVDMRESERSLSLLEFSNSCCSEDDVTTKPGSPNLTSDIASLDLIEATRALDLASKEQEFVALSLCGGEDGKINFSPENFEEHRLSYSLLCEDPDLFYSPKLIVRVNGQYYPWSIAAPIIMLYILSGKAPPKETMEKLKNVSSGTSSVSSKSESSTKRSWWLWRSKSSNNKKSNDKTDSSYGSMSNGLEDLKTLEKESETEEGQSKSKDLQNESLNSSGDLENLDATSNSNLSDESKSYIEKKVEEYQYSYRKMLRLSSEVVKKLNLSEGKNTLDFSIASSQGSLSYKCFIYKWHYNDKIIVSDIDGTITKSDVLGHLLPMVGKDWSQIGVAPLFNSIANNGYKILYLSSRALNQVKNTRDYINWVRQDNVALPDGPILLSPDSMFDTLHRELVEKKPELFKIACLNDIRTLFPTRNPFYAGYGNRINDVIAYENVGIPKTRIFTVNHKGEITFFTHNSLRTSYLNMMNIVDFIFSPYDVSDDCDIDKYVQCNYWRDPIHDIIFNDKDPKSTSPRSRSFRFPFSN